MNNQVSRLMALGRHDEAERMMQDVLARDQEAQPGTAGHAVHLHTYAELLVERGRWPEAREVIGHALEVYRPAGHGNLPDALVLAARSEARMRRPSAALALLEEARSAGFAAALDPIDPDFAVLHGDGTFLRLARPAASP